MKSFWIVSEAFFLWRRWKIHIHGKLSENVVFTWREASKSSCLPRLRVRCTSSRGRMTTLMHHRCPRHAHFPCLVAIPIVSAPVDPPRREWGCVKSIQTICCQEHRRLVSHSLALNRTDSMEIMLLCAVLLLVEKCQVPADAFDYQTDSSSIHSIDTCLL